MIRCYDYKDSVRSQQRCGTTQQIRGVLYVLDHISDVDCVKGSWREVRISQLAHENVCPIKASNISRVRAYLHAIN